MSMNTNIVGFRPPDEKWKKMKAIWDSCNEAGIEPPAEVDRFFNGIPPDGSGVEVEIENTSCCRKYQEEMRSGYEVEIAKLPKDIKIIRFWNSF